MSSIEKRLNAASAKGRDLLGAKGSPKSEDLGLYFLTRAYLNGGGPMQKVREGYGERLEDDQLSKKRTILLQQKKGETQGKVM